VFQLDSYPEAGLQSRPAVEHLSDAFVSFVIFVVRDLQPLL